MTPSAALAAVVANITTNGRGEITGAVMRSVLDTIIALDDNAGAIKSPVRVATTANITLSGLQTVDGISLAEGDRVLVKDQTDGTENGIRAASAGAWARTIDFDANATVLEGSLVFVMEGSTQAQSGWLQTAVSPTIGTTALVFTQFAGGGGGSALTVEDEGTPVDTAVTTINFTGTGVTATQTAPGVVDVAISAVGAPWELDWRAYDNEPPLTDYARLDTINYRPILKFDPSTSQTAIFSDVLPYSDGGLGVIVDVWWCAASATSGTIGWLVAIERLQSGTTDLNSDSFGSDNTITAATVPGTAGIVTKTSVTISAGANMDNLVAGEAFRIRIKRDVAVDTATGDADLLAVHMRSA